jgi:hypothetical protein
VGRTAAGTVAALPRPVASVLRAPSPGGRLQSTVRAVHATELPDRGTVRGAALISGMPMVATAMRTAMAWGFASAWHGVVPDGWPVRG